MSYIRDYAKEYRKRNKKSIAKAQKEYAKKHPAKVRVIQNNYRKAHPERVRGWQLKAKYGITIHDPSLYEWKNIFC